MPVDIASSPQLSVALSRSGKDTRAEVKMRPPNLRPSSRCSVALRLTLSLQTGRAGPGPRGGLDAVRLRRLTAGDSRSRAGRATTLVALARRSCVSRDRPAVLARAVSES